jgi:tRNA-dihydrouridine synthase A
LIHFNGYVAASVLNYHPVQPLQNRPDAGITNQMKALDRRLCIAPMMDWTDRHCRYLHRLFAPHALLYTEMLVAAAVVRGNAARLLAHSPQEHPVALQLGGCDPEELARAARIGADAGFCEINLNVGCPSDRVRDGAFGACLMLRPDLVAECVERMRAAVQVPVTVKCRIGVDERDDFDFFAGFVEHVAAAGVGALIVHARAALLGGLSPKENREIPPLRYDYVHRLKRERPALAIVLNGGLGDVASVLRQLDDPSSVSGDSLDCGRLDGVMLGRAAYQRPRLIAELERAMINPAWRIPEPAEIIEQMVAYAREQARLGVRLHAISRHMHGLIVGQNGARAWRRFLSEVAARPDAAPETLYAALPILTLPQAA